MLNRLGIGWSLKGFLANFIVPGLLNSAQISSLIKQADLAVFPNRCEEVPILSQWRLSPVVFQLCCLLIQAILI